MYDLINENARKVVGYLDAADVREYEWLLQNTTSGQIQTPEYQRRYISFWRMGLARSSEDFRRTYFNALSGATQCTPDLHSLAIQLHDSSLRKSGQRYVPFSFATKLVNMASPSSPIYDSLVADFYFFEHPTKGDASERTSVLVAFYEFLVQEYARVRKDGLLDAAIKEFRAHFNPMGWSDEKIIDSLIWSFVSLLRRREFCYR